MLRDEILHAAGTLIRARGYAAMSMDELAAHVGISKPTLYSHFATKDDLVVTAVMHEIDQITAVVQADTTPRSPLRQLIFVLRTVIHHQIDKGGVGPRPWAPEVLQLLCVHEEVIDRLRRIDDALLALVEAGCASGEIDSALEPTTVVRAFFALVNALHSPFLAVPQASDPSAIADTLATLFERGVRAPTENR
jgi:AcrR family transcriptional regulator